MKQYLTFFMTVLLACISCVDNPLDSKQENHSKKDTSLRSILTKSGTIYPQEDSLTMMNKIQKDVDYLMMNRIILKDSVFILGIKRQDALFIGVSEDVYDRYVEYVARLNEMDSE